MSTLRRQPTPIVSRRASPGVLHPLPVDRLLSPISELHASRQVLAAMTDRVSAWLGTVVVRRLPEPVGPPALASVTDQAIVYGGQQPADELVTLMRHVAIVLGCDPDYAWVARGWLLDQWLERRGATVNWNSHQVTMLDGRLIFAYRTPLGGSRRDGPLVRFVARYTCPECGQPLDLIEPPDLATILATLAGHQGEQCAAWTTA